MYLEARAGHIIFLEHRENPTTLDLSFATAAQKSMGPLGAGSCERRALLLPVHIFHSTVTFPMSSMLNAPVAPNNIIPRREHNAVV